MSRSMSCQGDELSVNELSVNELSPHQEDSSRRIRIFIVMYCSHFIDELEDIY
jgi:hypothetical protein